MVPTWRPIEKCLPERRKAIDSTMATVIALRALVNGKITFRLIASPALAVQLNTLLNHAYHSVHLAFDKKAKTAYGCSRFSVAE